MDEFNNHDALQANVPRRGRPPKTIGGEIKPEQERTTADTVTVTLVRGYVPRDSVPDANGVHKKYWPGEDMDLPLREAMNLVSKGIAKMELTDD